MVVSTNLYLQKKFSDYIVACEVELEEHGNRVIDAHIILCNIASSEYELELYRKCIKTCHRVLDLSPNCIRAHFLHMKSLVKLGKDDLCVKLSDIILNDSSGRFVLEDVNIILQIQDFVESVKLRISSQVSNLEDGIEFVSPEAPIVNSPTDITTVQHSVVAKCSSINVNVAVALEDVEVNQCCRAMNSTDVKCLSSPRNITARDDSACCNEPVQKSLTKISRARAVNFSTIASHPVVTQSNPNEITKNVPLSKAHNDFTTTSTTNEKGDGESNASTAATAVAHSRPQTVVTQQRVVSYADTEGNNDLRRLAPAVSVVNELATPTPSRYAITQSLSNKIAVPTDVKSVSAATSTAARARGSSSQQKKSRKPAVKDATAPHSPSSTSLSTSSATALLQPTSSLSITSTSSFTSPSSCTAATTIGLPNDSISKLHLEGYLSNCLTNEDALVTRTLLQSVRSNLCCAYGEDVVDDMIAYGYLKVNTGQLKIFLNVSHCTVLSQSRLGVRKLPFTFIH